MPTHTRVKVKLARKLNIVTEFDKKGKKIRSYHSNKNLFNNEIWDKRKKEIANKVYNREVQAQWLAKKKKEEKLAISKLKKDK